MSDDRLVLDGGLNIYQRIRSVMSELDSVSKTKKVKHGDKFQYIGHDDVTEAF